MATIRYAETVALRMPTELFRWLRNIAEAEGRSISNMGRELIQQAKNSGYTAQNNNHNKRRK